MARPRKHQPPLDESRRVSAYRKKLMQEQQYRSVSFLASPAEFGTIEAARSRSGLTTKELMLFYLSGRYLSEALPDLTRLDVDSDEAGEECLEDPELTAAALAESQAWQLAQRQERGEIFCFAGKQPFLLVSLYLNLARLPGLFPFDISLIRDFASHREAFQYYLLRRDRLPPAHQIVLMQRAGATQIGWEPQPADWYQIRLLLNQFYPQLPVCDFADDPLDYRSEWQAMAAEYANES